MVIFELQLNEIVTGHVNRPSMSRLTGQGGIEYFIIRRFNIQQWRR